MHLHRITYKYAFILYSRLPNFSIITAALFKNCSIISFLVFSGADCNKWYPMHGTPVHVALWYKKRSPAAKLIFSEASVDVVNRHGSLLRHSCHSKSMLRIAMSLGATDRPDNTSILFAALRYSKLTNIRALLSVLSYTPYVIDTVLEYLQRMRPTNKGVLTGLLCSFRKNKIKSF